MNTAAITTDHSRVVGQAQKFTHNGMRNNAAVNTDALHSSVCAFFTAVLHHMLAGRNYEVTGQNAALYPIPRGFFSSACKCAVTLMRIIH